MKWRDVRTERPWAHTLFTVNETRLPHHTAAMNYNPVLLPAGMDSSRPAHPTLGICKLIKTLPLENGSNATANFHLN